MSALIWDKAGEHFYETGVEKGVLYVFDKTASKYGKGVAWNGLVSVTESPTGADANPLYADNIKYLNLIAAEDFEATVEAYTYPDEFAVCDGSAVIKQGIMAGQQSRSTFALSYVTRIGNDSVNDAFGHKIHIIYGCSASPSERSYETVNDSPDAITFSWDITTVPVEVGPGFKPTAIITIDSTKVDPAVLKQIEDTLYGTTDKEPTLLLPSEILALTPPAVEG